MIAFLLLICWSTVGHLIYIDFMRKYDNYYLIKDMYDVQTFIFISVFGPLIYLFHDKS